MINLLFTIINIILYVVIAFAIVALVKAQYKKHNK